MKPTFFFLLFVCFSSNIYSQILISQYIETNSGSTPKGIEIFNYSISAITFTASNNLQISHGVNGGPCELLLGTNITSGTLASGEVWVIGTSDLISYALANSVNLSGTTDFGFQFNGDDALTLSLGGVVKDVFGTCGSDPGSSWSGSGVSTQNQNIEINSSVLGGTTSYWTNPSFRFVTVSTTNEMTGFGTAPYFSTLPVELISFAANCEENNTVSINWATASEHNSAYYTLEKSRDGLNWNVIATQPAAVNSAQLINYSVYDASAISETIYYRLTQVDIDGAAKVYDVISVNCSAESEMIYSCYPNPSNGFFHFKIENGRMGKYQFTIHDVYGKEQFIKISDIAAGTSLLDFDVNFLKSGYYFIKVVMDEVVSDIIKIVIN